MKFEWCVDIVINDIIIFPDFEFSVDISSINKECEFDIDGIYITNYFKDQKTGRNEDILITKDLRKNSFINEICLQIEKECYNNYSFEVMVVEEFNFG